MDAFFAKNRLSAYLDGSLSESEAAEVEQALAEDPALRTEYESLRRAVNLLRDVGPVKAPDDLHRRIMARVQQEPPVVGRAAWWRRTVSRLPMEGIALAAAALVVVIAIQWKPERSETTTPTKDEPVAVAEPSPDPAAPAPTAAPVPPPATTAPPERPYDLAKTLPVRTSGGSKEATSAPGQEAYAPAWDRDPETTTGATASATSAPTTPSSSATTAAEAASSGDTSVSMRTARYYDLNTQDPEILAQLANIAASVGGQLVTEDGQPASTSALTDTNAKAKVSLIIPQGQLGRVTSALNALSARAAPAPAAAPLYGADTVTLNLTVFYNP